MRLAIPKGHNKGRGFAVTGSALVNLYVEPNPDDAAYPYSLHCCPGLREWASTGTAAAVHGMAVNGEFLYAVVGSRVKRLDTTGGTFDIGFLNADAGRVFIEPNGEEVAILTDESLRNLYVAGISTVTVVTDADYQAASAMTYADGYHILPKRDAGIFYITAALDPSSVDALDFASSEARPDPIVRPFAFGDAVWMFGTKSIEVFYNSGNADFPFESIPGATNTSRGCAAKHSVLDEDNSPFWLGDDKIFYRADGYAPRRISTHAVESLIERLPSVSGCLGFAYSFEGHKFLVWTFPSGGSEFPEGLTLQYDISTGSWIRRQTRGISRWRGNCAVEFAGKTLIGDYANGKIYEVARDYFYDGPDGVDRVIETPAIWADDKRVTHHNVLLKAETGVGLTSGQGSDPQVMMQYSDDGGKTWSNEQWRSLGAIGSYGTRAKWRKLGRSRERIYRFMLSDPVRLAVHGLYGDFVSEGPQPRDMGA